MFLSHSAPLARTGDDDIQKTYIILLGEAKELSNLRRPLRAQALRVYSIGDAGDVVVALFDDREG